MKYFIKFSKEYVFLKDITKAVSRIAAALVSVVLFTSCLSLSLNAAYREYNEKNYKKSSELLQQYMKENPNNADAWLLLGQLNMKKRNFKSMKEAFEQAVKIDPDSKEEVEKIKRDESEEYYTRAQMNYYTFEKYPDKTDLNARETVQKINLALNDALLLYPDNKKALSLKKKIESYLEESDVAVSLNNKNMPSPAEQKYLAITGVVSHNIDQSLGNAILSRLYSEIFATKAFILIEREKIADVMAEQKLQLSGCTSDECLIEVGKILNARYILSGSANKIGNLYSIDVRLIDVQSGEIISAANSDDTDSEHLIKYGIKKLVVNLVTKI